MVALSATFADLDGAKVVITGGATGIGAALARGFAEQGCRVGILDINESAGQATVDAIAPHARHRPIFEKADLSEVAVARASVDHLAGQLGGIDVVVNNVAWDDRHRLEQVTEAYWNDNVAVNLRPAFFVSQAAVPHMRKAGGGSIINFSSIAFMMNLAGMPIYLTAKAGLIGMTKGLAGELGVDNIRVNAILPGMVLTPRQKQLWVTDESAEAHRMRQALKVSLLPEDMVGPCLFLASNCSAAITAQSIIVDGGYV